MDCEIVPSTLNRTGNYTSSRSEEGGWGTDRRTGATGKLHKFDRKINLLLKNEAIFLKIQEKIVEERRKIEGNNMGIDISEIAQK